jgi:hypothetical protein
MAASRFAIVGGADPTRNDPNRPDRYDPEVHVEEAKKMAVALGAELAKRGHSIIVYHSGVAFIETYAVTGFVGANPKTARSIIIRQPQLGSPPIFDEERTHSKLFQRRVDTSDLWEVSFYRSLADSDGVILIGGAYSTFNAGQVAIGARIPILALEKSGGAASKVWKTLSPGVDLPTSEEHDLMAHPPSDETVAGWVDALEAQRRRRYAVETGPIRGHALIAIALFIASLALAVGSHLIDAVAQGSLGMCLLLAATLLGGGSGAAIRMVFERRYGSGPLVPPSIAVTLALGMMAGALAGLLYLVAQPGTIDLHSPGGIRLVSIMAIVSVVGGLTVETVFRKLLGIDVVHTRALGTSSDWQGGGSGRKD